MAACNRSRWVECQVLARPGLSVFPARGCVPIARMPPSPNRGVPDDVCSLGRVVVRGNPGDPVGRAEGGFPGRSRAVDRQWQSDRHERRNRPCRSAVVCACWRRQARLVGQQFCWFDPSLCQHGDAGGAAVAGERPVAGRWRADPDPQLVMRRHQSAVCGPQRRRSSGHHYGLLRRRALLVARQCRRLPVARAFARS